MAVQDIQSYTQEYADVVKSAITTTLSAIGNSVDKIMYFIEGRINAETGEKYTLSDLGACDNICTIIDENIRVTYPLFDAMLMTENIDTILEYNWMYMETHKDDEDGNNAES